MSTPVVQGKPSVAVILRSGGWPLTLLVLVAALLRFYALETPSMWWDEILVPLNATTSVGDILLRAKTEDLHPPAFYLLIKLVLLVGSSDVLLRLPSVLAGLATLPLLFVLGAPRVGRAAALCAVAFMTVNGAMLLFSRQVRPYSLIIFLSLLGAELLLRWVEKPRTKLTAGLVAATCGYVCLHYLSILVLAVQGSFAAANVVFRPAPRPWKQLALYAGGCSLGVAATWHFFHSSPSTLTQGSVAATALLALDRLSQVFCGYGGNPWARGGLLALTTVGTALVWRRDRRLALLALGTILGPAAVLSLARYNSYFNAWHVSYAAPFLCLLAGTCLSAVLGQRRLGEAAALAATVVAVMLLGDNRYYAPSSHTGNYKEQARQLPAILRPGALVAYSELSELDGVNWYAAHFVRPNPLQQRQVTIAETVSVDFVAVDGFGHLAASDTEFLAHFDSITGKTPFAGGTVYHAAVRHAPPRIGSAFPWHDTLGMTPWDLARQCQAVAGVNLVNFFGGWLVPETGDAPGYVTYVLDGPKTFAGPLLLRLDVPFENPVAGNVVRLTCAFDDEPPMVAFESRGGEPQERRIVMLRRQTPFSTLRCRFDLEPGRWSPSMTGNAGAAVRLKPISLYANTLDREILDSASLALAMDGVGPVETGPEGQWRWALGGVTTLRFHLAEAAALTAAVDLVNPIAGQGFSISFNGRPLVARQGLTPDQWLIPSLRETWHLQGQAGENVLVVRFDAWNGKADAPQAAFAPGDGRPLAAAFTRLSLELDNPATILVY
ncbi:glycosyltransferase family 39 protein [Solidesulfovibrio carbinolicus]|nr:glycosyltransferase family 39 protein [Solidesulfovibrio carbinolicus]